jgi:hypothetical protein
MISRQARQGRKEPCEDYLKPPSRALRALRETFFHAAIVPTGLTGTGKIQPNKA